jgi:hypothetical protein
MHFVRRWCLRNTLLVRLCTLWDGGASETLSLWSYALCETVVPQKHSPCEAMHFVRRWCHCRKRYWKSICGMPRSNIVTLGWMAGMPANLCPFSVFFNLEKARISGAKSCEWEGLSNFVMDFLARNSRTLNASCAEALSWWRIHWSGQSSGLVLRTDSRQLTSTSR